MCVVANISTEVDIQLTHNRCPTNGWLNQQTCLTLIRRATRARKSNFTKAASG